MTLHRSTAPPPPSRRCPVGRGTAGPAGHRRQAGTPTSTSPPARPRCEPVAAHVADVAAAARPACTAARATLSQVSTALLERARDMRRRVRRGPRATTSSCFTRNTTDALNLLASGRAPGPRARASTSSTTRTCCPGAPGRTAPLPGGRDGRRRRWPPSRPRCAAAPTALLTVTGASNVTGEVLPLDRDRRRSRTAAGARVAVDAAQLAPHRRVDLAATGVDYVALSGHKLYAPFGAGALVGRRDWLDAAAPYLAGGGAVTPGRPRRAPTWAPRAAPARGGHAERARRRRAGRRPAGRSRRCWTAHGPAHERALLDRLARGPGRRSRASTLLRIWPDSTGPRRRCVTFTVAGRPRRLRRRVPVGRARHRRARRPVLRAPAARAAVRGGTAPTATAPRCAPASGSAPPPSTSTGWSTALHSLVTRGPRWTYAAGRRPLDPDAGPARPRPAGRRPAGHDRHRLRPPGLSPASRVPRRPVSRPRTCRRRPRPRSSGASRSASATGWRSSTRLPRESWWMSTARPSSSSAGFPARCRPGRRRRRGSAGGTQLPWSTTSTHNVPGSVHMVSSTTPDFPGPYAWRTAFAAASSTASTTPAVSSSVSASGASHPASSRRITDSCAGSAGQLR